MNMDKAHGDGYISYFRPHRSVSGLTSMSPGWISKIGTEMTVLSTSNDLLTWANRPSLRPASTFACVRTSGPEMRVDRCRAHLETAGVVRRVTLSGQLLRRSPK